MEKIEKSVQVNAPVDRAYQLWTSFERFPEFMENVESVKRIGERKLEWTANIGGSREVWEAEITALEPNQRVAWRSTTGTNSNSGEVRFEQQGDGCLVTASMEVEPDSKIKELASKVSGVTRRDVKEDLENFKRVVEKQ